MLQSPKRFDETSRLCKGKIIHLGANDAYGPNEDYGLQQHLLKSHKEVKTCDIAGDCDYIVDLNKPNWNIKEKFDTVLAAEVIDHLDNPRQFLRNCKKLLNKGGRLIVSTSNASSLLYIKNPSWSIPAKFGHCLALTSGMLVYLLEEIKFKNIKYKLLNVFWFNPLYWSIAQMFPRLRGCILIWGDLD